MMGYAAIFVSAVSQNDLKAVYAKKIPNQLLHESN
jgi:hypothetical protein